MTTEEKIITALRDVPQRRMRFEVLAEKVGLAPGELSEAVDALVAAGRLSQFPSLGGVVYVVAPGP